MAEVIRYVNTASTAGGGGTTNATAGANRAYATLSEWEANEGTDLVTDGDTHRVICSGGADSTAVTINGFTVGASNYVTIEGEWDASTGRLNTSQYHLTSTSDSQILCDTDYTVFDKVQFDGGATSNQLLRWGTSKNDGTVKNCLFTDAARYGVFHNTRSTNVTYFNNLFYEIARSPIGVGTTSTGMGTVYNCTAYNFNTANVAGGSFIQQDANDQFKVVNCIAIADSASTRADFEESFTLLTGSDYNASSDTSAPGANSIHSITDTAEFVSVAVGSEDFHLNSGSTLLGDGVGPSTDSSVPATDIDGDTRSGTTCDIGFDEYAASGNYTLSADSGSYTVTGTAVELQRGLVMPADSGSYAVSGTALDLNYGRILSADSGSYAVNGADATLTYAAAGNYTLSADSGSYAVNGADAELQRGLILVADSGSYTVSGTAVDLFKGYSLTLDSGAYTQGGTDVEFLTGRVLSAESGSYVYNGANIVISASGRVMIGRTMYAEIKDRVMHAQFNQRKMVI